MNNNECMLKYKPSRFNYIHSCQDGSLRLYNSMIGTKGLLSVPPENSETVRKLLSKDVLEEDALLNWETSLLIDNGYLVPVERDENKCLSLRKMNVLTSDKKMSLVIMPTEKCNFKCKYCYETFRKGKMRPAVQDAIINYVKKNIRNHTELAVIWFGGEPLEALDVIERLSLAFINICQLARKPYSASMTTNGYNLTPEVYNKLYDLKVYGYQITLDGYKDQHNSQRILLNGDGTFEKIVNNLLYIKKERKKGTAFAVRTNFTKTILNNIDTYLDFYSQNFGDDQHFSLFIQTVSDWGGSRIKDFSNEIIEPCHVYILKKLKEHNITLNLAGHCYGLDYGASICYASKKENIVIGSDGSLYKCTRDFEWEKNKLGRITEEGILLLNENYYLWLGRSGEPKAKCKDCFYEANCMRATCPYVLVSGFDESFCPPEKEHMGLFLENFNKNLFKEMRR